MKSKRLKIPIEEYLQMQHPFGYKVEYCNGEAVFQPLELCIDGHLVLQLQEAQLDHNYEAVRIDYQQTMKSSFFAAFKDTVEFCDWPEDSLHKHAEKSIDEYFSGARGKPSPASKLLLDQSGAVTALALFVTKKNDRTKLDLLLVSPELQHQGIATEMVGLACNELRLQGIREVYSSWHALNEASQHWHHQFGFTDVYDQHFIQRKYHWYRREVQRLESHGIVEELQELRQKKTHWYNLLDEEWQRYTRP